MMLGIAGAMLALATCERSVSVQQTQQGDIAGAGSATASAGQSDTALRFPFVPDPAKTPGATFDVTREDVCTPGFAKRVRDVPIAVKRRAYASYRVFSHEAGEYEIDHLIPLQLGGSNAIQNLWPESFRTAPWNAYVKDALEVELHRRVCAGTIDLAKAQQVIARNWVIGYRAYVSQTPPPFQSVNRSNAASRTRTPRPQSQPMPPVP